MQKVSIIGSGFSALAASCYLSKEGYDVTVFEKNASIGGRASVYRKDGFKFDMGPTWYWMPDVFERFFNDFNKKPSDYYKLNKLKPGYQVYYDKEDSIIISDKLEEIFLLFEKEEPGSSKHLKNFLAEAKENYKIAINDLVYNPGVSPLELITKDTIFKLPSVLGNIQKQIRKNIKSSRLHKVLEFPVLFLGAKPQDTPALFNFMNWADFGMGTWHPEGGMHSVVEAMEQLALDFGVKFETNANVERIITKQNKCVGLKVNGKEIYSDIVLSGADYVHTEQLLEPKLRQYSEEYWKKKTFAPSSILFYVGFNKKLRNVKHHTLFFHTDFEPHAEAIYDNPAWPDDPMFYASFPSITDDSFAPEGKEAATFLIPLAPDLKDTEQMREKYFNLIIDKLEELTNQKLKQDILFHKSYCAKDFKEDYNSYKGNAYGMANTLLQTAFLRPKLKSKKVENLYFTGQLTVPGPGVPPALISGKLVSELIINKKL